MKIKFFELKKIINEIIKKELNEDFFSGNIEDFLLSNDLKQIRKPEKDDSRGIYKAFDEHIISHNDMVLVELFDKDLISDFQETFQTIKRSEIENEKVKSLIDKIDSSKTKKIFIFHNDAFQEGKKAFEKYVKNKSYNFGFWILHDLGHTIFDRYLNNIESLIRQITRELFEKKLLKFLLMKLFYL